MKIASFRLRGLFGGRVVIHRQVSGEQQWRIKVQTKTDAGQVDIHELAPVEKLPLSALAGLAAKSIAELCPEGTRLVDACMDFYIERPAAAGGAR